VIVRHRGGTMLEVELVMGCPGVPGHPLLLT
jgi:hypothetical protein